MTHEELQAKYNHFKSKVAEMLDAQQLYFKTRDVQVLRKSKAIEAEVRDIITPKAVKQAQSEFNFLAR